MVHVIPSFCLLLILQTFLTNAFFLETQPLVRKTSDPTSPQFLLTSSSQWICGQTEGTTTNCIPQEFEFSPSQAFPTDTYISNLQLLLTNQAGGTVFTTSIALSAADGSTIPPTPLPTIQTADLDVQYNVYLIIDLNLPNINTTIPATNAVLSYRLVTDPPTFPDSIDSGSIEYVSSNVGLCYGEAVTPSPVPPTGTTPHYAFFLHRMPCQPTPPPITAVPQLNTLGKGFFKLTLFSQLSAPASAGLWKFQRKEVAEISAMTWPVGLSQADCYVNQMSITFAISEDGLSMVSDDTHFNQQTLQAYIFNGLIQCPSIEIINTSTTIPIYTDVYVSVRFETTYAELPGSASTTIALQFYKGLFPVYIHPTIGYGSLPIPFPYDTSYSPTTAYTDAAFGSLYSLDIAYTSLLDLTDPQYLDQFNQHHYHSPVLLSADTIRHKPRMLYPNEDNLYDTSSGILQYLIPRTTTASLLNTTTVGVVDPTRLNDCVYAYNFTSHRVEPVSTVITRTKLGDTSLPLTVSEICVRTNPFLDFYSIQTTPVKNPHFQLVFTDYLWYNTIETTTVPNRYYSNITLHLPLINQSAGETDAAPTTIQFEFLPTSINMLEQYYTSSNNAKWPPPISPNPQFTRFSYNPNGLKTQLFQLTIVRTPYDVNLTTQTTKPQSYQSIHVISKLQNAFFTGQFARCASSAHPDLNITVTVLSRFSITLFFSAAIQGDILIVCSDGFFNRPTTPQPFPIDFFVVRVDNTAETTLFEESQAIGVLNTPLRWPLGRALAQDWVEGFPDVSGFRKPPDEAFNWVGWFLIALCIIVCIAGIILVIYCIHQGRKKPRSEHHSNISN